MDRIWDDLLIHLRNNLSLTEYDTWIRQLKFKGIYGDDFVMITPSPQSQQHMQTNHTMVFTNGLYKVSGRKLNPVFIFGAENELDTPNLNPATPLILSSWVPTTTWHLQQQRPSRKIPPSTIPSLFMADRDWARPT